LVLGILPNLPGFLNAAFPDAFANVSPMFKTLYAYAWFVGLAISALVYAVLMRGARQRQLLAANA
jgi:NCS1 family nucleobase:cation symporter-1